MATSFGARVLGTAAALAVAVVAVSCGAESQSGTGRTSVESAAGQSAFLDVTVATSDGGQLDFGTLQGRDVVLWFWAPW